VLVGAKDFSRKRGISFKEALNELVRIGLLEQVKPRPKKPLIKPFSVVLNLPLGLNFNHIDELEAPRGPLRSRVPRRERLA